MHLGMTGSAGIGSTVDLSDYFESLFGGGNRAGESPQQQAQQPAGDQGRAPAGQTPPQQPPARSTSPAGRSTIIEGLPDRYLLVGGAAFFMMMMVILVAKR